MSRALANVAAARGIDGNSAPDPELRRPKHAGRGDWSSTIALRCARMLGTDPRSLADELADELRSSTAVAAVDVSGPGFLNITVSAQRLTRTAADIAAAGRTFGPDAETATRIEVAVTERIASRPELQSLCRQAGSDALRFLAASGAPASSPQAQPSLLRAAAPDNPVYFVQSVHAAACRIERRAASAQVPDAGPEPLTLTDPAETALLSALADFLPTAERSASRGEPRRITDYLTAAARLFVVWMRTCTVTPTVDEDITSLHGSRLVLDRAAINVLATGLRLLGVSAPERM
nr:DALR anticodon-binding domain-containing protein [Brevibacterium marinum]